jgi:hypothetical protein
VRDYPLASTCQVPVVVGRYLPLPPGRWRKTRRDAVKRREPSNEIAQQRGEQSRPARGRRLHADKNVGTETRHTVSWRTLGKLRKSPAESVNPLAPESARDRQLVLSTGRRCSASPGEGRPLAAGTRAPERVRAKGTSGSSITREETARQIRTIPGWSSPAELPDRGHRVSRSPCCR